MGWGQLAGRARGQRQPSLVTGRARYPLSQDQPCEPSPVLAPVMLGEPASSRGRHLHKSHPLLHLHSSCPWVQCCQLCPGYLPPGVRT